MKLRALARISLFATLLVFGSASPVHAELHVVDNAGASYADFGDIQAAIDASADGDMILILGTGAAYESAVIDGKGLSLVGADHNAVVGAFEQAFGTSGPSIEIYNLAADQEVLVRGLDSATGVIVGNCAGKVWFDDFNVIGVTGCISGGVEGAAIYASHQVTFTRSTIRGETILDEWLAHSVSAGLSALDSTVQLFDCEITGSTGNDSGFSEPAKPGGAGLSIQNSTVMVSSCTIQGGPGGAGQPPFGGTLCDATHPPGGAGVEFLSGSNTLRRMNTTVHGGVLDLDALCPGQVGPAGADISGIGTLETLVGPAHTMTVNGPVRPGESIQCELFGVEGELAAVLVSFEHTPLPFSALPGILLPDLGSVLVLSAGPLPATGQTTVALSAPSLGAVDHLALYAQSVFVDASPATWLGGGSTLVLLDDDPLPYAYPTTTSSWTTDDVALEGDFLDGVVAARIDGSAVDILSQDAGGLILERNATSTPGWSTVELDTATDTVVLEDFLQNLPTLTASTSGIGTGVTTGYYFSDNEHSIYNTLYSLGTYPAPLVLPGVHFGILTDLSVPSSIIATGSISAGFDPEGFAVPNDPGLVGVTVYLQGWLQGEVNGAQSFTNLASVTF